MEVRLAAHNGVPIAIVYPARASFDVVETEPAMKGQTASGCVKPAILSNGVRTMVPTHIVTGTRIVVLTADGSYVERAKD
jgi:elongation factor P